MLPFQMVPFPFITIIQDGMYNNNYYHKQSLKSLDYNYIGS